MSTLRSRKIITWFLLLVLAVIGAVFAAIFLLGIILISVWKCVTVRKDKLEFIKFKNEQERSQWGVVSTFCLFILYIHMHAYLSN